MSETTAEYLYNCENVAPFHVDCTAPEKVRDEQIINVVLAICPELFGVERERGKNGDAADDDRRRDFVTSPLCGGLSNFLFTVTSTMGGAKVLVRVHVGEDDPRFVDREMENRVLAWLSQRRFAPTYYGRFENGRVEEFYDDHEPLRHDEMHSYAAVVSRSLARLHACEVPPDVCATDDPGAEGEIWDRVDGWTELAEQATYDDERKTAAHRALGVSDVVRDEWAWLKERLRGTADETSTTDSNDNVDSPRRREIVSAALRFSRQNVLAHMDCQSLNLLRPSSSSSVTTNNDDTKESGGVSTTTTTADLRLIDFEYTGYNPRAADIANTFCEYCDSNNMRADYDVEYPSLDEQIHFLRSYLEACEPPPPVVSKSKDNDDELELFLEEFRKDVNRHSLLSCLGWTVWAVAQSYMSPIDFDYLAYAKQRMDGYFLLKKRYFAA